MGTFDLTQTVSETSIAFMMLGIGISFLFPIVFYKSVADRWKGRILSMVLGAIGYVTLERMVVSVLVLLPLRIPGVFAFFEANLMALLVYQLILNAVFLELGRYYFVYMIYQKSHGIGDAARMAAGYGGMESILLGAVGMFLNITMALAINQQGLAALTEGIPGEELTQLVNTIFNPLINTPSAYYLMSALEGVAVMLFHMAQTFLLYLVVTKKGPKWLWAAAMGCRLVLLLPAGLYNSGRLTNLIVEKTCILLAVALACGVSWFFMKKYDPDGLKRQEKPVKINTRPLGGIR